MKISIGCKCSDLFWMATDGHEMYEGYVPKFMPGGGGDYLELDIDTKTGQILNWNFPKDEEIIAEFPENEDEEEYDESFAEEWT